MNNPIVDEPMYKSGTLSPELVSAKMRVDTYHNLPTLRIGRNKFYGFRIGRVPRKFHDTTRKLHYTWFTYKGYIFVDSYAVSKSDINLALDRKY